MSIYLKQINIENIRGIKDKTIKISDHKLTHLILTGKNGSGKTSVLNALAGCLDNLSTHRHIMHNYFIPPNPPSPDTSTAKTRCINDQFTLRNDIKVQLNILNENIFNEFNRNNFVLAYFGVERSFEATQPTNIEKVNLQNRYTINESPLKLFIKFLADLRMSDALAYRKGDDKKVQEISNWLDRFEDLLKEIFCVDNLTILFDDDSYNTSIIIEGKEIFDFNTLSSGYSAVLNIVIDLILRMQKQTGLKFVFDMCGIVLIDEIETHLHIELQKMILGFLTKLFPNIQFIISTHSPFILNSLENVVIYDLEKNILVENGLNNVSYSGVVEGYFNSDLMSNKLKDKFEKYKMLVNKTDLTDLDFAEIESLENTLAEIPDFLAVGTATEFERLKLEFNAREDI